MRFMEKCKDIEYVRFNRHVWKKLNEEDKDWIVRWCYEKLVGYYGENISNKV